ncbi:MAG: hypothetical protein J6126_03030, partial [Clostridia bacterium]|nr:hypothetical protein [Clostridia bacterium]
LSETVKNARAHFDNIIDENQLAFIGDELAEKLVEAESEMRLVKKRFNIPVTVVRLTYNDAYRSEYVAGETFDNTGLEFTIIYDDGSTELADSSEMTLVTTGALGVYDRYVTYSGYGTTVRVMVAVSAAPDQGDSTGDDSTGDSGSVTPGGSDDDSSDTDSSSSKKPGGFSGCKGYAGAELGLLSAVLGLGALVILKKKR